jgi:hypothetical protein
MESAMPKLEIFDPPMCCPSGVCGPSVDPVLPRFAADLDWLKQQGVNVARYNPAQEPQAFAGNPVVTAALAAEPEKALPLVLLDGRIVSRGAYPSRQELAAWVGLAADPAPAVIKKGSCCGSSGCC